MISISMLFLAQSALPLPWEARFQDEKTFLHYRQCVEANVFELEPSGAQFSALVLAAKSKCREERKVVLIDLFKNLLERDIEYSKAGREYFEKPGDFERTFEELDTKMTEDLALRILEKRTDGKNAKN